MTSVDHLNTYAGRLALCRMQVLDLHDALNRARQRDIDFMGPALQPLLSDAQELAGRLYGILGTVRQVRQSSVDRIAVETMAEIETDIEFATKVIVQLTRVLDKPVTVGVAEHPALDVLLVVEDRIYEAMLGLRTAARHAAEGEGKTARRSPTSTSVRVANLAVRLLPWDERERYLAEYLSELDELAQDLVSRRAQLRYALRLLVHAPALRRALRAPVKEKWWPIH
jgi:hypothetical protein